MIRLDGTSILVEGRGVRTSLGGKPAIQVALRDISESKRAENALRESEGKLNAMLQSIPDIMSMMDEELTIMWANEPAKRYFGKDIVGKKCYEAYHLIQGPCEPYPCLTLKAFLDGKPHQHETMVIDSQGQNRFFECTATVALRNNSGKPVAVLEISRDITDKKKVDDELRESEEKYRTLIERANDGIVVIQDNIVKMCNHYITEFWGGGTIDQMVGRNYMDFIHPDALPDIVDRYNRRMAGESLPSIYESTLKRKDGSRFFAELNAGIISYEGRPANLIIVRDINERKRTENTLRESEVTARALINAPTDSVLLIDDQGMILALNEIAASRFGKRGDELVGTMSYDLLPKEIAQLRRSLMAPVLEKKEMVRFMDERAGRWYDTVAYPILNETGEVKKIAIIARDITEQKTFEKLLLESELMYKRLLEQRFDAIAIHKEGKIAFLNDRAAKILGASRPEDLMGKSIFEFIHPDSRKEMEDRIQKLTGDQGTTVPVITEKFIRTDGSTITVEVLAISFDDNDIPAFRVAFREISPCDVME
jgi:PAS domain S-box-containing protein